MPEETAEVSVEDTEKLLVSLDEYLANGVHVGLKYRTADMKPFIYKVRQDKLCVFDIQKIDERLRTAAKFIASYDPKEVLVVSNRVYGRKPIRKFAEYTGVFSFDDRFVSGSLTNPNIKTHKEPKLIVVTDPTADNQALKEAANMGVTVLAICDSNTRTKNIDFVVPSNNKGKNALALIYWILTREVLRLRGMEDKFDAKLEDYISAAEPQPYLLELQERQRAKRRRAFAPRKY
jgi:small subunit ribosomal protein S2